MAGPLSGIGAQTQIPQAAQSQSASQNNQGVRQQEEREVQSNEVQAPNAAINESQESNADNLNAVEKDSFFAANLNEEGSNPNARRGEIIDIAV